MERWRLRSLLALSASAVYLYGFPSATITFGILVLFHVAVGILLTVLLLPLLFRLLQVDAPLARVGWIFLALGAVLGIALIFIGTLNRLKPWLYAHIAVCVIGALFVATAWLASRGFMGSNAGQRVFRFAGLVLATAAIAAGAWWSREVAWRNANRIVNPQMPAASMDGEGAGPQGKLFPSSAQTKHNGYIPAKYFMQSDACQRCHADIYKQWYSSAHHFSSFNNQWYRKSIEYMQEMTGTRPSKWCGGCHDLAVLFNGMMDTPIKEIIHTPEAQVGLACTACHSIVRVNSSMGQGDYLIEYPPLHDLATSKNPLAKKLHDFLVRVDPE